MGAGKVSETIGDRGGSGVMGDGRAECRVIEGWIKGYRRKGRLKLWGFLFILTLFKNSSVRRVTGSVKHSYLLNIIS